MHEIAAGLVALLQPTTKFMLAVAARLHDDWRFARTKVPEGEYDKDEYPNGKWEPRIKEVQGAEVDIANLHFDKLPEKFQHENLEAAKVACNSVKRQTDAGYEFDDYFYHQAAIESHNHWIKRNEDWISDDQKKPFDEQLEDDRERTIDIVKLAVAIYHESFKPF